MKLRKIGLLLAGASMLALASCGDDDDSGVKVKYVTPKEEDLSTESAANAALKNMNLDSKDFHVKMSVKEYDEEDGDFNVNMELWFDYDTKISKTKMSAMGISITTYSFQIDEYTYVYYPKMYGEDAELDRDKEDITDGLINDEYSFDNLTGLMEVSKYYVSDNTVTMVNDKSKAQIKFTSNGFTEYAEIHEMSSEYFYSYQIDLKLMAKFEYKDQKLSIPSTAKKLLLSQYGIDYDKLEK